MMTIIGTDISSYQDKKDTPLEVNFETMLAAGARFSIFRANFGMAPDRCFHQYVEDAKTAGMPIGCYTFPLSTQNLKTQMDVFFEVIKGIIFDLPLVLDVEKYTYKVKAEDGSETIMTSVLGANDILYCLDRMEAYQGRAPMIYTGFYVWRDDVKNSSKVAFTRYPLWIAGYGVSHPEIPKPWVDYTLWQYTNKGKGLEYGVESLDIDLDKYNGDEAAFAKFISRPVVTDPIDPIPSELILTAVNEMKIRSGPGLEYPQTGTVPVGSTVMPIGVGGKDSWVEIRPGQWVCNQLGNKKYLIKQEVD
jgi:lysozyme